MPQSSHATLPELSSQLHDLIQEGWEQEVVSQLPATYEQQARLTGAFRLAEAVAQGAQLPVVAADPVPGHPNTTMPRGDAAQRAH